MDDQAFIAQTNPKAGYLARKDQIDAAMARVMNSGWYILGNELSSFEAEFARYLGLSDALGVANGTDAIELSLRALEIGPGDAVLTVSHTAVATVAAIERCGAHPVLVDIDPETFTMDPRDLEVALHTKRGLRGHQPRAVIPVHLYGHPADMPAILEIVQRYGLRIIEDCAQAHGSRLHGQRAGTFGDLATFSFYPTKNLGAFGDGGMVVTGDERLAQRVRSLREYGWEERYVSQTAGINSRLDELQAAILSVLLPGLDADNARRRENARLYDAQLVDTPFVRPTLCAGVEHVFHQYVVRCEERDGLREHLRRQGIGTAVHYPVPVHLQPAYRERIAEPGDLPHTERAAGEILSLPMSPHLTAGEIGRVCSVLGDWLPQQATFGRQKAA